MEEQSSSLIRFISSLDVKPDNTVYLNGLDMTFDFVSRFYTPHVSISVLANSVLRDIASGAIPTTVLSTTEAGILKDISDSGLNTANKPVYTLTRVVLLEVFSILYTLNDKPSFIKYIEVESIEAVRQNIKYIVDALGKNDRYSTLIRSLQAMDIDLGYIQAEIPEMKERWRVDGTL